MTVPRRSDQSGELIILGLGANVGSEATILSRFRAVARLVCSAGGFAMRASHIYRSTAVGPIQDQSDFLNSALGFRLAGISARDFLPVLWRFENALGRTRPARPRKGPRPIDIDVLHWRGQRHGGPLLAIPHPRAGERAFARRPLAELLSVDKEIDDANCARAFSPMWLDA